MPRAELFADHIKELRWVEKGFNHIRYEPFFKLWSFSFFKWIYLNTLVNYGFLERFFDEEINRVGFKLTEAGKEYLDEYTSKFRNKC